MSATLVMILVTATLAGASPMQDETGETRHLIEHPSWRIAPAPTEEDYPLLAAALGLNAEVELHCWAMPDGHLSRCRATSATPAGIGFEPVAIEIAYRGSMNPGRDQDGPRRASVAFTLRFRTFEFMPHRTWKGPGPSENQLAAARHFVEQNEDAGSISDDYTDAYLAEVQPDLRPKIQAWLKANLSSVMGSEYAIIGIARVMAQRELTSISASVYDEDPDQFESFFNEAFKASVSASTDPENLSRLRASFCRILVCGPQD